MTKERSKLTDIILGFLASAVLWVMAIPIAGRIPLGEDLVFWNSGVLVFIFPFLFFGASFLAAKKSAEKKSMTFLKAFLICFSVPLITYLLGMLLAFLPYNILTNDLINIMGLSYFPLTALVLTGLDVFDNLSELTASLLVVAVNIIPVVAGMIVSLYYYKTNKR